MAKHPVPPAPSPPEAVGPLQRWSRRKLQHRRSEAGQATEAAAPLPQTAAAKMPVSEADLPCLDTLDEHSELGGFFAEGVSESLRRSALRKIFHLQKYNVCDGLDDYAEDYTRYRPLGNIVTADLRLRLEREQLKRALDNDRSVRETLDPGAERGDTESSPPDQPLGSPNDDGEPVAES
jgi:hypothetical protein